MTDVAGLAAELREHAKGVDLPRAIEQKGLSSSTIHRALRGASVPTLDTLSALASLLGLWIMVGPGGQIRVVKGP